MYACSQSFALCVAIMYTHLHVRILCLFTFRCKNKCQDYDRIDHDVDQLNNQNPAFGK